MASQLLLAQHLLSAASHPLLAEAAILNIPTIAATACSFEDPYLANTTSGLFQGYLQPPHYIMTAFLSIPYAVPPTGDLRFAAPEPYVPLDPEAFQQATAANVTPNACPQLRYHTLLDSKNTPLPESEDCLTISVWRSSSVEPQSLNALLPVLIFIHGGGYTSGGTTPYLGIPIISQNPDLIFVSINYRLGILGFPNPKPAYEDDISSSKVTPNAGLLDQRLAIEWIHANIASFGGDPAKMTVMGHSAGSQSLGHYAFAYADDPLVRGMILWSGMPEGALQDRTGVGWRSAVSRTGCRAENSSKEIACLKALPARHLLREGVAYSMQIEYDDFTDDGWTPGVPSPDNVTNWDGRSGVYIERALKGDIANVPTWIQTTMHEADDTSPFDTRQQSAWPNGTGAINQTAADVSTLVAFQCPAWLGAGLRLIGGSPRQPNSTVEGEGTGGMATVYRSIYNGTHPAMRPFPWMNGRAYHGEDVFLLFNDLDNPAGWWGPVTEEMRQTAWYLRDAVAAFVRDPEQGLGRELEWRAYEGGGETLQVLFNDNKADIEMINATEYDAPCREIWKDVLPPV